MSIEQRGRWGQCPGDLPQESKSATHNKGGTPSHKEAVWPLELAGTQKSVALDSRLVLSWTGHVMTWARQPSVIL